MNGWMDGRMDTCREIPDPEPWLRIGSRCIGSRVRNASRLVGSGRQPGSQRCSRVAQVAATRVGAGKNASSGRFGTCM